MTIYGETLVIGIDLRDIKELRPRGITENAWWEEYKGFWPNYIDIQGHHSLFMFAMGTPAETIVFGARAEYYFTHFQEKSFVQFKKVVAREISRVLRIPVSASLIQHHYVQYLFEEEELDEGS